MQSPKTILISPLPNYMSKLSTASPKSPGSVLIANTSRVNCIRSMEKMTGIPSPAALLMEEKCVQSRKRRLDHLTIEEKLQRKKLKNRVAAQTSRDRKKAKMDELEAEVLHLRQKAKDAILERDTLRQENRLLVEENEELRKRLTCNCQQTFRGGCRPAVAGPAESNPPLPQGRGTAAGSGSGGGDDDGLPSLLAELAGEDCLLELEELANSLFQEASINLEGESKEVLGGIRESCPIAEVVGQTSKDVEACGRVTEELDSLPKVECEDPIESATTAVDLETDSLICLKKEPESMDTTEPDMLYGTYDEVTQTVTIILPDEDGVCVEEAVQEVVTSEESEMTDSEAPVSPYASSLTASSPRSPVSSYEFSNYLIKKDSSLSDCGYESLDSPQSEVSCTDGVSNLWNDYFSDIFPALV